MKTYNKDNLPRHVLQHSPDGMNWGYGGSGPSDLALSLLTEVVGLDKAQKLYQAFKWDFVANWDDDWSITEKEIFDWVNAQDN